MGLMMLLMGPQQPSKELCEQLAHCSILFWAPAFTSTGGNARRAARGKMAERRKAAQASSLGGAEFSCSPNKPSRTNTAQVFQSHFH